MFGAPPQTTASGTIRAAEYRGPVYVDDGVAAPDGSEYTVEAFKANRPGPGRSGSLLFLVVAALRGDWRLWRVRVRPWPAKLMG
jgi:hypothetical protein